METKLTDIALQNKRTGRRSNICLYQDGPVMRVELLSGGKVLYTASADLIQIQRSILGYINNAQISGDEVGWSWSDVTKNVKKIAKKVGAKKLLSHVNTIMKHPAFAKGMALASSVYPPLGITYAAVRKGADLLDKVRSGDTNAQAKLVRIADMAAAGNPQAQQLRSALSMMYKAQKGGFNVSGWAYNLPYRDSLAAGESDDTNPRHIARKWYNAGMTLKPEKRPLF